jgi:hypothetical protein
LNIAIDVHFVDCIENMAVRAEATSQAFVHGTLRRLPATRVHEEGDKQQTLMMAAAYAVLKMAVVDEQADDPDLPSPVLDFDFAATQDIRATLTVHENEMHIRINGRPIAH